MRNPTDFTDSSHSNALDGDNYDAEEDKPEPALPKGDMRTKKSGAIKAEVEPAAHPRTRQQHHYAM